MTTTQEDRSGLRRQLDPEEEQVVGTEGQIAQEPGEPLPVLGDIDRIEPPLPARSSVSFSLLPGLTAEETLQRVQLGGLPVLFMNRYEGVEANWQMLARWDVLTGVLGDLHEISLATNNSAKTRYRILIANREMSIPDRQVAALLAFPFRNNNIPGPTSVTIEVRSTDGTTIIVDGFIVGSEH